MSCAAVPAGPLPPLHVVTDDAVLAHPAFAARAADVVAAGGARLALHLRGPRTSGKALYEAALRLAAAARAAGGWLLVNDRIDVALAARAHGIQLPGRSLPPADARRVLGGAAVLGVSVHDPAGAALARPHANFVVAGHVFATPSHPNEPGRGTKWLATLAQTGLPVIAIGGIAPGRVAQVIAAGAAGVAVQRGIWEAADPADAVLRYLERL